MLLSYNPFYFPIIWDLITHYGNLSEINLQYRCSRFFVLRTGSKTYQIIRNNFYTFIRSLEFPPRIISKKKRKEGTTINLWSLKMEFHNKFSNCCWALYMLLLHRDIRATYVWHERILMARITPLDVHDAT